MITRVSLFVASALALGGCVPMMAASAVGAVASGVRGAPVSNAALKPQAEAACQGQAQAYGPVHIIDVEQRKIDDIIVWGTAGEGAARQSFECHFGTRVTSFRLRAIPSR
ncbi:MAG: hypothetical protein ABIO68_02875 [Sphingomicrobium sp.]